MGQLMMISVGLRGSRFFDKPGYSLHWGKHHDEIIGRFTWSKCWIVEIVIPFGETNWCFSFVFVKLGLSFAILFELQRYSEQRRKARADANAADQHGQTAFFFASEDSAWSLDAKSHGRTKYHPLFESNTQRKHTETPETNKLGKQKTQNSCRTLSWTKVCHICVCVCAEQLFWW